MVPATGLEPVRCHHRGILSPLCLPIPPRRQIYKAQFFLSSITNFMSVRKSENLLYEPFFILHIYYIIFFYKNQLSAQWRGAWDSNPATTVLETAALPLR